MANDTCSVCEKSFDRGDIEFVELGKHLPPNHRRSFNACHNCAMLEKLSWYKVNYEQAKDSIERLREENNLFRTLMLKVETMEAIGSEPAVSTRSYILQHRPGWEALPVDTLLLFLDLYHKHAETFAAILSKKATREEINSQLKKKSEVAKATDIKRIETAKVKANDGLTGVYTVDEKKAVLGLMKTLKLSEEKAFTMVKQMTGRK